MTILHVSPDAPAALRYAAGTILFLHIGGGSVGIVSGYVALLSRKGERLHRAAGNVFFVAMLIMSAIGAIASPFLPVPSYPNVVMGILTFYLVATSWATVRRKEGRIGGFDKATPFAALVPAAFAVSFALLAAKSPTGKFNGYSPAFFCFAASFGAFATALDLKVILSGGIAGAPRIARHLWRMCTALSVGAGSFFLGQQKIMPVFMRGSPLLFVPVLAPLVLLAFWQIRVRLAGWYKHAPAVEAPQAP